MEVKSNKMKKIHITEEQLEQLRNTISESSNELTIDAQPNSSGKITTQDLTTQYNDAKTKVGGATNIKLAVDGADLTEGKFITKKQIQEAKLNNLKKNCTVYKKGNIC